MKREPLQILVVDDEADICWALENILRLSGYAVTTTTKSTEALELLTREAYTVAFVDAMLPNVDGLELATLIHQRSPHTTVILISGYYYREDRAITEGLAKNLFTGFIAKPFDLEEVRRMAGQAAERV